MLSCSQCGMEFGRAGGTTAVYADARNYYTHYDQELWQSGKVAKGLELRRIMYVLHALLQVCLLKELGVEGKPIERILERNNSIKWADLQNEAKS